MDARWSRDEVPGAIDSGDLYVARRERRLVGCFLLDPRSPSWMRPWLIEHGREPTQAAHLGKLAVGTPRPQARNLYGAVRVDRRKYARVMFPSPYS